ncbi:MAG: ABC transporter substrate-binding protein [Aggregatilineales bacterium]
MRLPTRRFMAILTVLICIVASSAWHNSRAQAQIVLTLSIASSNRDLISDSMISSFEQANPGIKVTVVLNDTTIPAPTLGVAGHLAAVRKYASTSDVLIVTTSQLTVEATLAGYFLNLSPLVAADSKINIPDFYPTAWRAYQWNGGIWALPASTTPYVLSYHPAAFDKAQLAYPTDRWTIDDLANAIRKLAVKDSTGKTVTPGMDVTGDFQKALLFRSLLGTDLVDSSVTPNTPRFNQPAVDKLLNIWAKLESDNLIGASGTAPLSINIADDVIPPPTNVSPDQKIAVTLLPGNKAGLEVQGIAVSAGTRYPDQAYALARFLTTRAEFVNASSTINSAAARKSVSQTEPGILQDLSADMIKLLDHAFNDGITIADLRYTNYVLSALFKMTSVNTPSQVALSAAETQAMTDMQTALGKKSTTVVIVPTPIPTLAPGSGKITLKFGILPSGDSITHLDQWNALAVSFAKQDPLVGQVSIDLGDVLSIAATKFDCFYLPFNAVPDADLKKILNISPLADSDPTFNKADFIGSTLTQMTRANKLWGMPIQLEPAVMIYNSQVFKQLGVPTPTNWTIDSFTSALKTLRTDPKALPPFVPFAKNQDGTSLLMLITAYGGLPIDYRTTPPTINFTSPETVTAIQEVLDLVKQGYMQYAPLGSFASPDNAPGLTTGATLYADTLNVNTFPAGSSTPYKPTLYPSGSKYTAVSYSIGSAYISAKA